MRGILLVAALLWGLAVSASAQNADIEATIGAQFEAFKADDFAEAFTHASPNIQNMFRTPENFGAMVRNGYPMVWRPADIRYLELREVAGSLWQRVMITDAKGVTHLLDYQMLQLENGWKINGVQILQPPEANV
ncbi:DUF4864 domain-containing protein [Thalassococcus sp. S3]|uniref:DUF4864 domain-containing protein n=1 Tax=Thalassococcus sp. S3 TaxID=2017482 RepID=UPI0010241A7F|nr:DUF4864 domain-containing protein [Thalassococcus sp. S3]QBF30291.1 DUF4864 domain-containing protein [Thalassococcus sp. S3]